ncbi:hypothetical protein HBI56_140980 [Parastagonospora nodorum]|nr:hypothetical protein HBH53_117110 [Parastagonospora nodorum]KAH3971802.1 hypothetical protein HBH52_155830 [Parastagonospora nodorum]KAH3996489.1 hypothetical protein HBI10_154930 [Parastagonospora nodorum]KAH4019156.1 hypothetical protein HBI13_131140 [Parastagonospora nodorum]KAH4052447.1 hypothetical protein HBH49_101770 [Parastagonospora nodorum]
MSSRHHHQHGAYPAPLAPLPINGPTTLIALRGFVSGQLAFRRSVTAFPTFDDIFLATYEAWQNDPDKYHLHLHFCQGEGVLCSREDLLERISWESGVYFIGGTISVFAHFAKRPQAGPEPLAGRLRAGQSERDSGLAGEPTRTIRRQNPDAKTAYSLCQPTERQYFSTPFVFISCPGLAPRVQLFPARIAERWPGFSFEITTSITEKQASSPVEPKPRSSAAASTVAPPIPAPIQMSNYLKPQVSNSDSSDDRISSPEYGVVEEDGDDEEEEQPAELGVDSVPRATESLLVAERGASEESESLFISE